MASKRRAPQPPPLPGSMTASKKGCTIVNNPILENRYVFYDVDNRPRSSTPDSRNSSCRTSNTGPLLPSAANNSNNGVPGDRHATNKQHHPISFFDTTNLPPPYPPPEHYEKHDQIITIMSLQVQNKVRSDIIINESFFF